LQCILNGVASLLRCSSTFEQRLRPTLIFLLLIKEGELESCLNGIQYCKL
jgi:hypothetical protein